MTGKTRKSIMPFILLCLLGCTTLTPAQRVLWGLNVYQNEYNNYLEMTINPTVDPETKEYLKDNPSEIRGSYLNPNITEEDRKMLRVKKEILIELKPIILMAEEYQRTGVLPPDDIQKKMIELINRLVELQGDQHVI